MHPSGEYYCAYCGEPNEVEVDAGGGGTQRYIEDCQVCCRPNMLSIAWDEETGEVSISAEQS